MKIEPCPLCASKARTFKFALVFWGVKCTSCMLVLKDMNTSEVGAIKQWGSRLSPEEKAAKKGKKAKTKSKGDFLFYVDGELISVWAYEEHIPDELSRKHCLFISDTITAERAIRHRCASRQMVTWNCNGHCKLLFRPTEKE